MSGGYSDVLMVDRHNRRAFDSLGLEARPPTISS